MINPILPDFSAFAEENKLVVNEMGIICNNSRVGEHKCSVKTRFGWCCDVCLENELMWLYNNGVHTINSCCGHGEMKLASILVVGDESKAKMGFYGYSFSEIQPEDKRMAAYVPKTPMIYLELPKGE